MNSPVVVALDFPNEAAAVALAQRLSPQLCRLKVGKELFTRSGPQLVETLQGMGFEVFLDLKFHDIPNTVAGAVRAAADLGVWMVNVHARGGRRMLEAAAEALTSYTQAPLLIGVTVLTSMSNDDLAEMGYRETAGQRVDRLAGLVADTGLNGVVCSAQEAPALRAARASPLTYPIGLIVPARWSSKPPWNRFVPIFSAASSLDNRSTGAPRRCHSSARRARSSNPFGECAA